jgi:anti-sigma factor RsiW
MDSCTFDNLVIRYHDDELDFQARVEFEQHLSGCAVCTAHLAELRQISSVLSGISFAEIQPAEQNRLHAALQGLQSRAVSARRQVSERAILRMAIPLAALAASVLVVTSTFLLANIGNVHGATDLAATSAAAPPHELTLVAMQSDSRLPAWMVRSLGGDAP